MGVFNFLKKGKTDADTAGMELPPVPHMDGEFPDFSMEETPPLPESSLPPLPSEFPQAIPQKPEHETLQSPKMEFPSTPVWGVEPKKMAARQPIMSTPPTKKEFETHEMPTFPDYPQDMPSEQELAGTIPPMPQKPRTEQRPKPEFPSMPEQAADEIVPDRIPPLEGIPDAPEFTPEPEPMHRFEPVPEQSYPDYPEHTIQPFAYLPPEEKAPKNVRHGAGPLYIRTDTIRAVLDYIEQLKSKFTEEDNLVFRLKEVKSAQDEHYESFRQTLEDIQRKLLFIDRSLFESTTR